MSNIKTEQNTFWMGKTFKLIFSRQKLILQREKAYSSSLLLISVLLCSYPDKLAPHPTVTLAISKCLAVLWALLYSTFHGPQHRTRVPGHSCVDEGTHFTKLRSRWHPHDCLVSLSPRWVFDHKRVEGATVLPALVAVWPVSSSLCRPCSGPLQDFLFLF